MEEKKIFNLGDQWKLEGRSRDLSQNIVVDASVPGHVHKDLLRAGYIKDPFWRDQAEDCQWVEDWEWIYSTDFIADERMKKGWPFLEFEGLDTYTEIYFNNKCIGTTENMFRTYRFDIGGILQNGTNHIEVRFKPVADAVLNKPYASFPAAFTRERIYVRRMQCTFGWDWVNRFVSYGIWKPVSIAVYGSANIDDVFIYTRAIDMSSDAQLYYRLETEKRVFEVLSVMIEIISPGGEVVWKSHERLVNDTLELDITLSQPECWWPAGMGGQPLYIIRTTLLNSSGDVLDQREDEFGIRTIQIKRLQDMPESSEMKMTVKLRELFPDMDRNGERPGSGFTLVVNGIPVFCKGANWVPCEPFPSDITEEKYGHLIQIAWEGHINMLRCWGGGIYEHEIFWKLCNKYGIMVCQDFAMACAKYPEDDLSFVKNFEEEVRQVVCRLRNHPCLVWWNGDNENGMESNYDDPEYNGRKLAEKVSGRIVREEDSSRPFIPTSPYGGYPNNSATIGMTHYTGTLSDLMDYVRNSDMKDYKAYFSSTLSRFCPEYPMFGTPEYHSLMRFLTEEDLADDECRMMEYHTKDNPGVKDFTLYKTLSMMADKLYPETANSKEFIQRMAYVQYEIIRLVIESYRRSKWYSSGLLFWMYNDSWPASGWSIVDYYGFPKAGYFGFKKAAKPVSVSIYKDNDKYRIWVCNDMLSIVSGILDIYISPFYKKNEKFEWYQQLTFKVEANSSVCIMDISEDEIRCWLDYEHVLVASIKGSFGEDRNIYFEFMPYEMKLLSSNVRIDTVDIQGDRGVLTVTADNFAKAVVLDGKAFFSDNYFDLLPGECKLVEFRLPDDANEFSDLSVYGWN